MPSTRSEKIFQVSHILGFESSPKRPISKSDLANRIGCPVRTMDRVFDDLKHRYSAPLKYCGKSRGWYFDDQQGYQTELHGVWFSKDDLTSIFAIKQLISNMTNSPLGRSLDEIWNKITRVTYTDAQLEKVSWHDKVKILEMASRKIDSRIFKIIVDALIQNKKIKIDYKKPGSDVSTRVISPIQLTRYRDNWFLDSICHLRESLRLFSISQILSVTLMDEIAEKPNENERIKFFADSYGIYTGKATNSARIRFFGPAAEIVSKEIWHKKQESKILKNGTFEIVIPYHDSTELIMDIVKWGKFAMVISPKSLQLKLRDELRSTLDLYKNI